MQIYFPGCPVPASPETLTEFEAHINYDAVDFEAVLRALVADTDPRLAMPELDMDTYDRAYGQFTGITNVASAMLHTYEVMRNNFLN